jgi:hypothetical protein
MLSHHHVIVLLQRREGVARQSEDGSSGTSRAPAHRTHCQVFIAIRRLRDGGNTQTAQFHQGQQVGYCAMMCVSRWLR